MDHFERSHSVSYVLHITLDMLYINVFIYIYAFLSFQELKGKFLIKGKRLNKLETTFAAAETDGVTEEEESDDENEQKKEKSKVGVT